MAISSERRAQLVDKYGINKPPVPSRSNRVGKSAWPRNDTLGAILDAEMIVAKTFTRGSDYTELFDPTRSPEMHAVATKAHREFRLAMARGDIEFITARPYGGAPYDPDDPNDTATLVHYVGDWRRVRVPKPARQLFGAPVRRDEFGCGRIMHDQHRP